MLLLLQVADSAALKALHDDEGSTLQLHQPQRFFDPCWRLLASLERQLGCLVGSNAYLTPAGSQVGGTACSSCVMI
jgi:lysine-specific demethylase/histidyl-hydroxylase NO66